MYENFDLLSNSELLPWPSSLGPRLRILSRGGPLQGLPASYSLTAASGFPTVARRETERTKARCGWSTTCRGGLCESETQCWLCCQWALLWVLCWSGWKGLAVLPVWLCSLRVLPVWLFQGGSGLAPLCSVHSGSMTMTLPRPTNSGLAESDTAVVPPGPENTGHVPPGAPVPVSTRSCGGLVPTRRGGKSRSTPS